MLRNFSDRVFAGICGGLGQRLRINPWVLRLLWAGLTVASMGFAALAYLALWWVLPQDLPTAPRRGGFFGLLLTVAVIAVLAVLWVGRDQVWLQAPSGQSLFVAATMVVLSAAFLLRQVRA